MGQERLGLKPDDLASLLSEIGKDGFEEKFAEIEKKYSEKAVPEVEVVSGETEPVSLDSALDDLEKLVEEFAPAKAEETRQREAEAKAEEEKALKERVKPNSLGEFFDVIDASDGEYAEAVVDGVVDMVVGLVGGEESAKKLVGMVDPLIKAGRGLADNEINKGIGRLVGLINGLDINTQGLLKNRMNDLMELWNNHEKKGRAGVYDLLKKALDDNPTGVHLRIRSRVVDKLGKGLKEKKLIKKLNVLLS